VTDDIVARPLYWKQMQVSLFVYEDEQAKKIVEDELIRKIPVGSKHFNTHWHTYFGEDYADCFITYYEVPND
jgi:hypothetical protein